MGILDTLGLRKKTAPTTELHPQAANAHGHTLAMWLQGNAVEVLNPTTDQWEDCPQPYFDPQYAYRTKAPSLGAGIIPNVGYDQGSVLTTTAPQDLTITGTINTNEARIISAAPVAPAIPVTTARSFQRGDIVRNQYGNTYLVLGNKAEIFTNYDASRDPDGKPIVVMRFDEGVKNAVSCRNVFGGGAMAGHKYNIEDAAHIRTKQMPPVVQSGDYVRLFTRSNMKDIYLCRTTHEVKFM